MHLIQWLNQHPPFIEEVESQIREQLPGRAITHGLEEGIQEGTVTEFQLSGPLVLEFAECVGLTCSIPFHGRGVATGITAEDGEPFTTPEGDVFGYVDVAFPEEGWGVEAYLRMYPRIERAVCVEPVEFNNE
ncbi:MAG: hypothetical protein V4675_19215 [Verrucomicrobiota bacterium]